MFQHLCIGAGDLLPANANNTRSDQFLDLRADAGVLHMFVQGGWVALGLLQDRLHDRVGENLHCVTP